MLDNWRTELSWQNSTPQPAFSYRLEELIKGASERLCIISPFLKVNERIKDLLEDKARSKIVDIRVIYGKNELQPEEKKLARIDGSYKNKFLQKPSCKMLSE